MKTHALCPICASPFTRIHAKNRIPLYCSRACRNRSEAHRSAVAAALKGQRVGPDHPRFKGEWIEVRDGTPRAIVWIDEAMRARLNVVRPYAARARVVWALAHPDEPISKHTPIHHINGDALDDRPENLRRMANGRVHAELHAAQDAPVVAARRQARPTRCEVCAAAIPKRRRFCSTACTQAGLRGDAHPNSGRKWSPDVRENMAAAKRGKQASPETRERMRQAHLARWAQRKGS